MTKMKGMVEAVTAVHVVAITMMKIMTIGVEEAIPEMVVETMMTMGAEAKEQDMDQVVVHAEDLGQ